MKFSIPAAFSSSIHSGAPATINMALLLRASNAGIAYSAYSGFFGSKPFSRTNEFLRKNNIKEIDWKID